MRIRFPAYVSCGLMITAVAAFPVPANALRAWPPAVSAHAFTGTVKSTKDDGAVALVRTDDGREVTVRGARWNDNTISSVDRTFVAGTRYEFHPVNDGDPYLDNACTATRQLAGGEPGLTPGSAPASTLAWWLLSAAGLLAAAALGWLVRRVWPVRPRRARNRSAESQA